MQTAKIARENLRVKKNKEKTLYIATKTPTNLLTVRLKIWQFLRAGRVTQSEDICDCRLFYPSNFFARPSSFLIPWAFLLPSFLIPQALLLQWKFQALFCGCYTARILNFELSFKTQYLKILLCVMKMPRKCKKMREFEIVFV